MKPMFVFVEAALTSFALDAKEIVTTIQQNAKVNGEVPIEDGFDLYTELVEIRRIHMDALPG